MIELNPERPGRDAPPRLTDYEEARRDFRLEVPERYNPVLAIVETWAAEDPDAPAVLSLTSEGELANLQTASELAAASRRTMALETDYF